MMIGELFRLFAAVRLAAAQGDYQRAATLAGVTEAAQRRTHNVNAGPVLPVVDAAVARRGVRKHFGGRSLGATAFGKSIV
jgi:hypothetical protein